MGIPSLSYIEDTISQQTPQSIVSYFMSSCLRCSLGLLCIGYRDPQKRSCAAGHAAQLWAAEVGKNQAAACGQPQGNWAFKKVFGHSTRC